MQLHFKKAKTTLEIVMAKLGLTEVFHKLMFIYNLRVGEEFEATLIKLLYRCLLGLRSI